jgi:glycosyltransferase involved in cell wall biosynthesis
VEKNSPVIVIIGYRIGLDPTFSSEFLKLLEFLKYGGNEAHVLVLPAIGELLRKDLRAQWKRRMDGVPPWMRRNISRFPVAPSRFSRYFDESWLLALALRMRFRKDQRLTLHAVGSRAGFLSVRARRHLSSRQISVLFRSVGPTAEEYLYRAGGPMALSRANVKHRYDEIRAQESCAYRHADAVVSLSEPMRRHAVAERGESESVANIGCFADVEMFSHGSTEREHIRRELGWHGSLAIVHSGTLHPWQRPAEIVRIFEEIYALEPRSRLVMLTRDRGVFEAAFADSIVPRERCTIVSLDFSDVPRYLAAADIGLIGRGLMEAPLVINAFSSPIKFAEYLAAGCPVLMGEGIGDFSEMAKRHELGLVLSHDLDVPVLRERIRGFLRRYADQGPQWRKRCQIFAENNLDVRCSIDRYQALYAGLAEQMAR